MHVDPALDPLVIAYNTGAGGRVLTWRTTRKSYSIRTAASFCLTVGLDPGKSSTHAAT